MQTAAIREVSTELIATVTSQGQILGITNKGSLVGVIVPITKDTVQRMAYRDAVQVDESARLANDELASGVSMSMLSDVLQERGPDGRQAGPSRLSIRELSGARLERAAQDGRPVLITSGRVTLALLVPLTQQWLSALVEGSVQRFIEGTGADGSLPDDPAGYLPSYAVVPPLTHTAAPHSVAMLTPQREIQSHEANSGREINLQRAIGISIIANPPSGRSRLHGVTTDMLARVVGDPIDRELATLDEGEVFSAILNLIDDLSASIGGDGRPIGIGLEVGGHVNDGRVVFSANTHWSDFPIADRLNAVLRLPVVLENDATALAILERRFDGVADDNLAVVLVTYLGIGCGLIVDGRIVRGAHGMAGEIGHSPMAVYNRNEIGCRCGNHDCLECVATPHSIAETLRLAGFKGGYQEALANLDSPLVRGTLQNAGAALGRGAATIINLLNPSAIVFYGPPELFGPSGEFRVSADPRSGKSGNPYLASVVDAIRDHSVSTGALECRFLVRSSINVHNARAAAACIINHLLPTSQVLRGRPVMINAPVS